ncbi:AAA domain-containing protein [Pelagicoccus albus]|uniref:AAA family ATPase n=1 Tax=Pelagicoccus albus TaxID=415222 RepID=A0A7X1E9B9_9BACT|nr:AAA domain-containing protein [Pelagicoccus albus]MBC2605632.1 AAA family ATPase [Pelagicoccus albus]
MSESDPRKVLVETLEYVKKLVEFQKKVVWQISEYTDFAATEGEVQGLPGIRYFFEGSDGGPVWMEIERLHKDLPPELPEELEDWVENSDDPEQVPTLVDSRMVTVSHEMAETMLVKGELQRGNVMNSPREPGMSDVRLLSEDNPSLEKALNAYLEAHWYPWSVEERPRRDSMKVYHKLFSVQQKMVVGESDGPLEAIWGLGHSTWIAEGVDGQKHRLSHPLIEFQVEFELNGEQTLLVRPRSTWQARPRLNLETYETLGISGVAGVKRFFDETVRQLEEDDQLLSADDSGNCDLILRSAASQLSGRARYWPDIVKDPTDRSLPNPSEDLAVTDTWALFVRKKAPNALSEDIERLQSNADKVESTNDKAAFHFAQLPSDEKPTTGGMGWPASGHGSGSGSSADRSRSLYFPKPFNDAQREIVRRLEDRVGVVVQGPPGTGKTHTIANIICHYLATGRRVLVTAKSETALKVLKNQIPKPIQPLVVSLVSSDREGMRQQKEAIETLQAKVISLQGREGYLHQEISRGEVQLESIESELEQIARNVETLVKKQLEEVKLPFLEQRFENATELAKWVVEGRNRYHWFTDKLGNEPKYNPTFSRSDLEKLKDAKEWVGEDLALLGVGIPRLDQLPSTEEIARAHRDFLAKDELEAMVAKGSLIERIGPAQAEKLGALGEELRQFSRWLDELGAGEAWQRELFEISFDPSRKRPVWYELARELDGEIDRFVAERTVYLRQPIDLGTENPEELAFLREAAERAAEGKPALSFMQRMKRGNRELLERVRVVGQSPNSTTMWKHIVSYYIFQDNCRSLVIRWNAVAKEGPLKEVSVEAPLGVLEGVLARLRSLEEGAQKAKRLENAVYEEFKNLNYRVEFGFTGESLRSIAELVDVNVARYRLSASEATRHKTIEYLCRFGLDEAKDALELVKRQLGNKEKEELDLMEAWRLLCLRFKELHDLQPFFQTIDMVCRQISESGAPIWARRLRADNRGEEELGEFDGAFEAWSWSRAKSVFEKDNAQAELTALETKRLDAEKRMRTTLESIVEKKTFLALCGSMSDRAKSLLSQFVAAISNIGGGTGKKAPFFRAAAQKAMYGCSGAIPCWVMPSWRASEVLPSEYASFDLVVVDEASQCDIRELPALARARKVLVVGDDKQVSPTIVGLDFNRVVQLKHNYLRKQPFADLMLPESSLYDLASSVFAGGQILLNEHFRCVEPIVRFSFQFYRKDGILPVRVPKAAERIDPPLIGVYVKDGYRVRDVNEPEALAIVDEIEKLVDDPVYEKRSIGVISMVGHKQAQRINDLLLDRIGQKKFLTHDIVCGDSATFQGREKDIMFLSLVVAPGKRKIAKVTSRMWEQRYNVAASRARDRMYVYYSFEPSTLQNDDLKSRLIAHLKEPMPQVAEVGEDLIDLCESPFEQEVFSTLVELGYSVTPQVPCAGRRIDLVIEGESDSRLAVELDGDTYHGPEVWLEDWSRQKILERVGWKFWRCWYSSFVAAPDECIASLVARLEEEGIKPTQGKSVSRKYSEFRTVGEDEIKEEGDLDTKVEDLSEIVEVGDTVTIARQNPKYGYLTLKVVEAGENLANYIYKPSHPVAVALLGMTIEDELDLDIGSGVERVCIVSIGKSNEQNEGKSSSQTEGADQKTEDKGPEIKTVVENENNKNSLEGDRTEYRTSASVSDVLGHCSEEKSSRYGESPSRSSSDEFVAESRQTRGMQTYITDSDFELSEFNLPTGVETQKSENNGEESLFETEVRSKLKSIVEEYGPMLSTHAILKTSSTYGDHPRQLINKAILKLIQAGDVLRQEFCIPGEGLREEVLKLTGQPDFEVRPDSKRNFSQIPSNELMEVIGGISKSQEELSREELETAVIRFYGKHVISRSDRLRLKACIAALKSGDD